MTQKNAFSDLFPPSFDSDAKEKESTYASAEIPQEPSVDEPSEHKEQKTSNKPHYHGHRDRLRQRFMSGDANAMADYEIVEMLLFLGIPRKDVKPLAKQLLERFESLPALLSAEENELLQIKGMTQNAVCALKLVKEAANRMMKQELLNKPVLNSWERLTDYLYASMAHEKRELFRILLLDRKNNLIADEVQHTGTVDQTQAYPREIVKRALELSATAIILVHNHPSGDPAPSAADIEMTQNIIDAAAALDITIHDHVIVSRKGIFSFRSEGLVEF
jgi:DNA repair protein RadC